MLSGYPIKGINKGPQDTSPSYTMTTPILFTQSNSISILSHEWTYNIAIPTPSGMHIGLPTSPRSTLQKKNETLFDPIGVHLTDRKILSHQNQNKLNPVKYTREHQATRQIMRKSISHLLTYLIKKKIN